MLIKRKREGVCMKFKNKNWNTSFEFSKELLKNIKIKTNETKDDIIFNLISALDQKWTYEDIDKIVLKNKRSRGNFGTFKVITYNDIKIKCTIGYNPPSNDGYDNPYTGTTDKYEIYISMTPATGQWLIMDPDNTRDFLNNKEKQIIESLLLGSDQSSVKVPCRQRRLPLLKDQSAQRVQQLQVLDDSCGSSCHKVTSPIASKPLAHETDSSKQSLNVEDCPSSLAE